MNKTIREMFSGCPLISQRPSRPVVTYVQRGPQCYSRGTVIALPRNCAEYKPSKGHKKTPAQVLALLYVVTIGTGCAQVHRY